jgi:hypothetical protein
VVPHLLGHHVAPGVLGRGGIPGLREVMVEGRLAIVSRYCCAARPAAKAYSPRSPVSSGQPRPIVSPDPGSTGSHWLPSRYSPYPSNLERCQNGPFSVW